MRSSVQFTRSTRHSSVARSIALTASPTLSLEARANRMEGARGAHPPVTVINDLGGKLHPRHPPAIHGQFEGAKIGRNLIVDQQPFAGLADGAHAT